MKQYTIPNTDLSVSRLAYGTPGLEAASVPFVVTALVTSLVGFVGLSVGTSIWVTGAVRRSVARAGNRREIVRKQWLNGGIAWTVIGGLLTVVGGAPAAAGGGIGLIAGGIVG